MFFFRKKKSVKQLAIVGLIMAVLFAKLNPILSKLLYEAGWKPVSLYFMVLLVMTIFMAVHEFLLLEKGEKWGMTKEDFAGTFMTALTSGVLSPLLFFEGLKYVQASEAVLITSIGPFFIVLFATMFLGERFTQATGLGAAFLIVGIGVLIWPELTSASLSKGTVCLLLSAIFSSMSTILHKRFIKHRHQDSILLVRTAISLVIVTWWMAITDPHAFRILGTPQNVWLVIALPLMSFLVPSFLYYNALKNVKAMEAGMVASSGPIIGVFYGIVFLGEELATYQLISLVLIVVGILQINVPLTKWRIVPSRLMEIGPLRK